MLLSSVAQLGYGEQKWEPMSMEFALGMKLCGEKKKFVMKRHYWAWTLSGYFSVILKKFFWTLMLNSVKNASKYRHAM